MANSRWELSTASAGTIRRPASRFNHLVEQYPLYSKADEALWNLGQSYERLDGAKGNRFRKQAGDAYARIVRDYPLSSFADDAKKKLKDMELPVPEADQVALNRMKWEQENRAKARTDFTRYRISCGAARM